MRKIILAIIWIIIIVLFPLLTYVYDNNSYKNNVPYISSIVGLENIDITLDVKKDNSIDVTEAITFNYVEGIPFKGIKVNLPLKDNIDNKRNIKLSDISSTDVTIDLNKKLNNYELDLGTNSDGMTSGLYTYTIKYHYDLGDSNLLTYKIFDNFYNIDIMNLSLTMNFEEKIDKSKVKFISNNNDVTSRITYDVDGNLLGAYFSDIILDNDIIVQIDLEDYFTNPKTTNGNITLIMLIIIMLLTIIFVLFNIRDHKKIQDKKALYTIDIKHISILILLIAIEVFIYLFIHDLPQNLNFLYCITYLLISIAGLIFISRLSSKSVD